MTDISTRPPLAADWHQQATSLCSSGEYVQAFATVVAALGTELDPAARVQALNLAALCALGLGRAADAVTLWQQAVGIDPRFAEGYSNLAVALRSLRRLPEAARACELLLALQPDDAETLNLLGAILCELRRLPEAEAACRRSLAIRPVSAETNFNLGIILTAAGRLPAAVDAYRDAIRQRPDVVEIHNNLGCVLRDLDRFAEAAQVFREALKVRPNYAQAAYNLGNVLKECRSFDESEAAYRLALSIRSDYHDARFGLSTLLLSRGRFDEGWPLYESRYDHPDFVHRATQTLVRCPQWHGEPLEGKSVLVWQEDGLGDMIHFGRYFAALKARGAARVTFACVPALQRLFSWNARDSRDLDSVIAHQTALANASDFDCWTSPLSLPLHLQANAGAIPHADYLRAEPELIEIWRSRVGDTTRATIDTTVGSTSGTTSNPRTIGLVWKGNPKHHNDARRSLASLDVLAPLWSVPDVRFVSLQKGSGEDEAKSPPATQPLLDFGSEIGDLADTAAIISLLDLVICVDTSVAHLAASLGKPCWILLPDRDVDWRWMHDRTDSLWYPGTIRLFRKSLDEDWSRGVERVCLALNNALSETSFA